MRGIFSLAACATLASAWKFGEHYGGIDLSDFDVDNETKTCHHDTYKHPFNEQVRGVNIGSWMVLEPWITPSMFYQFLGKDVNETAMDQFSFCKVLGPEEANKQMRRHWDTWVTREDLEFLASRGINSLRLPIGDFQYNVYPPYHGCFDGSLEKIDWLLDTAYELGMNVLLDVHAVRGSQNGFDNGGMTLGFEWTSTLSTEPMNIVTFAHWPLRDAGWMGKFNRHGYYEWIDHANIQRSLETLELIVKRHKDHPAVLGLEPVNEPWQCVTSRASSRDARARARPASASSLSDARHPAPLARARGPRARRAGTRRSTSSSATTGRATSSSRRTRRAGGT